MDLLCKLIIILEDALLSKVEIVGRDDHNCIQALLQCIVGKFNNLIKDHGGGAGDQLNTAVNDLFGECDQFLLLLHGQAEKFADAAEDQNAVHAACDQMVVQFFTGSEIQLTIGGQGSDCGSQIIDNLLIHQ